jgi:hypothetical protein
MNSLLKILWMIPVNVCQCERSYSCLRRLKTNIRNTTGQERLSGLCLVNIERTFHIDLDTSVNEFVLKNKKEKNILKINKLMIIKFWNRKLIINVDQKS